MTKGKITTLSPLKVTQEVDDVDQELARRATKRTDAMKAWKAKAEARLAENDCPFADPGRAEIRSSLNTFTRDWRKLTYDDDLKMYAV